MILYEPEKTTFRYNLINKKEFKKEIRKEIKYQKFYYLISYMLIQLN
jgi:hypothetical protein